MARASKSSTYAFRELSWFRLGGRQCPHWHHAHSDEWATLVLTEVVELLEVPVGATATYLVYISMSVFRHLPFMLDDISNSRRMESVLGYHKAIRCASLTCFHHVHLTATLNIGQAAMYAYIDCIY